MNVENQNVYITLKFMKKHNNQRLILCICHFNILFCRNCFPISSIINTFYHPSIGKMCYYVKRPPEFSFITNHLPSMSP